MARDEAVVFVSVTEAQKARLGRPFAARLGSHVRGIVVAEGPLLGDAFDSESKVDAYLDISDAVVVFATADIGDPGGRFTRPNISDEIARARSKPHLRARICVLKEDGVTLASNTNPVYNRLDPDHPEPAFRYPRWDSSGLGG